MGKCGRTSETLTVGCHKPAHTGSSTPQYTRVSVHIIHVGTYLFISLSSLSLSLLPRIGCSHLPPTRPGRWPHSVEGVRFLLWFCHLSTRHTSYHSCSSCPLCLPAATQTPCLHQPSPRLAQGKSDSWPRNSGLLLTPAAAPGWPLNPITHTHIFLSRRGRWLPGPE